MTAAAVERAEVAIVTGNLWDWAKVKLELVSVQSGVVREANCWKVLGRSPSALSDGLLKHRIHVTVALGKASTPEGKVAFLDTFGAAGVGCGPTPAPEQHAIVIRQYERDISWWKREIVYVEGMSEPDLDPGDSLTKFCRKNNRGEWLLLLASLE